MQPLLGHTKATANLTETLKPHMKYQYRVLGMLSLLSVITYLDRVCIAVAGPRMQDALHISSQAWGWVSSAFFLSYAAFEIPTGALGDRVAHTLVRRYFTDSVVWLRSLSELGAHGTVVLPRRRQDLGSQLDLRAVAIVQSTGHAASPFVCHS